jgi:hypothetical protein
MCSAIKIKLTNYTDPQMSKSTLSQKEKPWVTHLKKLKVSLKEKQF